MKYNRDAARCVSLYANINVKIKTYLTINFLKAICWLLWMEIR